MKALAVFGSVIVIVVATLALALYNPQPRPARSFDNVENLSIEQVKGKLPFQYTGWSYYPF